MRRYDIVAGILLILSIINFALASPVFVQEKSQASVDVANIPRNVATVLGKRWGEEMEELGEEYFKTSGKSIDSSGTHSSSSSAPYPASSTSNPDQSMEPSCSPSTSSMQGLSARGNTWGKDCLGLLWDALSDGGPHQMHGHGPMMYSLYRKLPVTEAPALQPKPNKGPSINPSADPKFDQDYSTNAEDPPPSSTVPARPARPNVRGGQASGYAPGPPPDEFYSYPGSVVHSPSPGAESPTEPEHDAVPRPQPSPDPELQLDHQSLSAASQPVDPEAVIYALKGKAILEKESRHVSGTAGDVGNAVRRELQPAESHLNNPGE